MGENIHPHLQSPPRSSSYAPPPSLSLRYSHQTLRWHPHPSSSAAPHCRRAPKMLSRLCRAPFVCRRAGPPARRRCGGTGAGAATAAHSGEARGGGHPPPFVAVRVRERSRRHSGGWVDGCVRGWWGGVIITCSEYFIRWHGMEVWRRADGRAWWAKCKGVPCLGGLVENTPHCLCKCANAPVL